MPVRLQHFVNDNYYHIFNRGVNRQPIFGDVYDYKRFINLLHFYKFTDNSLRFSKFLLLPKDQRKEIWSNLEKSRASYVDIVCYCLMPNHFHLLLKQTQDSGIVKFMSDFQNSYARFFNTKSGRVGPLFQGRFKTKLIETNKQLLHVSRYIHLNPSSSNIARVDQFENYMWSSFPEYFGDASFGFCSKDIILNNFKDVPAYKKFVFDNADYQKRLKQIEHLINED